MKNIVSQLQRRQLLQADWSKERRLVSSLAMRQVLLSDILDASGQLLDGHVVLGFSRCGQLLLSYRSELDVTATLSTYTLHWWLFLGHSPLQHVFREPLFRGEPVPAELHLLVCQTPPPTRTVVVGCRRTFTEDFHRPCYVSILPCLPPSSPSTHHYSLHFKFDLMPPFPSFIPSLSLRLPDWVVLNTGDSVVALHYFLQPASCPPSPSPAVCAYSSHLRQVFGSALHPLSASPSGSSPSHLLPVDVYCGDKLMADVTLHPTKAAGAMCVCQVRLDVELWVNGALQAELASRGLGYHSLTDYDLQLVEVCAGTGSVVIILVVLLEASAADSPACLGSYSVEVIASWNIHTGAVCCIHMSRLKPTQPPSLLAGVRQWNPAAPLALGYRHRFHLPLPADTSVRAFSNHTVFSGKSLRCLRHPFLPLSLTLTPSPHPSPALHS